MSGTITVENSHFTDEQVKVGDSVCAKGSNELVEIVEIEKRIVTETVWELRTGKELQREKTEYHLHCANGDVILKDSFTYVSRTIELPTHIYVILPSMVSKSSFVANSPLPSYSAESEYETAKRLNRMQGEVSALIAMGGQDDAVDALYEEIGETEYNMYETVISYQQGW